MSDIKNFVILFNLILFLNRTSSYWENLQNQGFFKSGNIQKEGKSKVFSPEEIDICNQIKFKQTWSHKTSTTLCKTLDVQLSQKSDGWNIL